MTAEPRRFMAGILPLNKATVGLDVLAGVTLAAIAIPEVMGYTSIARMPVVTGLYTILIPLLAFALLGSSRHLVIGADSATAAILAAGLVGTSAVAGSDEWVALAAMVALMAGGWLLIARFAGLGFVADFLSSTVLVGFLTGVGIQVGFSQIGDMFGIAGTGSGPVTDVLSDLGNIAEASAPTIAISIGVAILVVGGKMVSQRIPGALVAVAGSIAAAYYLDLGNRGVALIGPVVGGLPQIGLPEVTFGDISQLVPLSLSVFIVILAQSAATSRAYASKHGEPNSMDEDLVGLGVANLTAGLSGTFMVAGSPTKTQIVSSAGGRSQVAQLTTVAIVGLVLVFFTDPLEYMPTATLATVVFIIAVELVDVTGMSEILRQRPIEFWVATATALIVVFIGVEQGIILAIMLSLLAHTRHSYRPKNSLIAKSHGVRGSTEVFPIASGAQAAPGLMIYRFTHDMYYANAETLSDEVLHLMDTAEPSLRWFCIDLAAVTDIDYTSAASLRTLHHSLADHHVAIVFSHVSTGVRLNLDLSHVTELVGADAFYTTTGSVLRAYKASNGAG